MRGSLEKKITLDLEKSGVQARFTVRQGDALVHKITVRLTVGGTPYRHQAKLAQFYALLPDGSTVSADGRILPDGSAELIPGGGFFRCGGPVLFRLVLRGADGGELYSPAFAVDADATCDGGEPLIPAEEYSRLEELFLRTLAIRDEVAALSEEIIGGGYKTELSDEPPLMNGTASPGAASEVSRADHVHPADTTRMPAITEMAIKATFANADGFPVYDNATKTMKRTTYATLAARLADKVRESAQENLTAFAATCLVDPTTGNIAYVPFGYEDMSEIALRSDIDAIPTEEWTFTLADGTTVKKKVMLG